MIIILMFKFMTINIKLSVSSTKCMPPRSWYLLDNVFGDIQKMVIYSKL